jgi:hypothetical protein
MAGFDNRELLNSALTTTTGLGTWIETTSFIVPFTIDFTGFAAGDKSQVRGSNAATQPAASEAGRQIGTDVSAAGIVTISAATRWIKVMNSARDGSPQTTVARLFALLTSNR